MQVFHLMLATIVIYLFVRFSPFTNTQKILFSLGYFPLFEYGVISRNYVLGILLLFSFCALFQTRAKSYVFLSAILILLANTSVYGEIIAISLGLTLLFECLVDRRMLSSLSARKWDLAVSLLAFAFGIASGVYQIIPSQNGGYKTGWATGFRIDWLVATLTSIWRSYVPIPDVSTYQFWNSNILMSGPIELPAIVCAALSMGLLTLTLALLTRKPVALFLYLSGTLGILLFTYLYSYIRSFGSLRHHGHLFLLVLVSLWIGSHYSKPGVSHRPTKSLTDRFNDRFGSRFITAILCVHLAAGLIAMGLDLFNPFSASTEASQFIKDQRLSDMVIAGTEDLMVSPLAALLDRRIYWLESDRFGSFVLRDDRRKKVHPYDIPRKLRKLLAERNDEILLIANYDLAPLFTGTHDRTHVRDSDLEFVGVSAFTRSIVPDEQYYLYLVRRKDQ